MRRFSFGKSRRLVTNSQFQRVMARRIRLNDDILTLYIAKNDQSFSRLGISVGRSYGKAIARNRFKRLAREVFRNNQNSIPSGLDCVFMPSPRWKRCSDNYKIKNRRLQKFRYKAINDSFLKLLNDALEMGRSKHGLVF